VLRFLPIGSLTAKLADTKGEALGKMLEAFKPGRVPISRAEYEVRSLDMAWHGLAWLGMA
jgi:hypothetical protein